MDTQPLTSAQLMDRILESLNQKLPCSIISVGQTEAVFMGQDRFAGDPVLQNFQFHLQREAEIANSGFKEGFYHRGIRFPNPQAQQQVLEAVKAADFIGYNTLEVNAKTITERVFSLYDIEPKRVFEANIRRVFMKSHEEKFKQILKDRKVLLIGSLASQAMTSLKARYSEELGCEIVGAIPIYEYEDIPNVKQELSHFTFDICFLSAGINAVILAPYIAQNFGKVAFDIGSGMKTFITNEVVTDSFIDEVIGLDNLMNM
ncbi:GT-D fold domain-containing glycosyltransferase [Heyndrickxia acidicola]|uniref:GT-D fold domain-containing glycosyltransferase n=1 Tax=Heyndrickxia acidicola TaxID=209389 RepID=A0ABU6MG58_9BACI|nr:GT-D fold domain-containing glycosyltransferase [Heyndrickxia acidicola]MED1203674.1 GT-D fold domain-containing glycosyltransferase [Heyndrickxia acidicola]